MALYRKRTYPYPDIEETDENRKMLEYLRRLHYEMEQETSARIEDFHVENIASSTRCRAYLAADQTDIADTTWTKVLLDTENFDSGSHFASNKFTATQPGYYQVCGQVRWINTVADKKYYGAVYKNGESIAEVAMQSSIVGGLSCPIADTIYLADADYLELYAYHDSGAATPDIDGGSRRTYLSVYLLSI